MTLFDTFMPNEVSRPDDFPPERFADFTHLKDRAARDGATPNEAIRLAFLSTLRHWRSALKDRRWSDARGQCQVHRVWFDRRSPGVKLPPDGRLVTNGQSGVPAVSH